MRRPSGSLLVALGLLLLSPPGSRAHDEDYVSPCNDAGPFGVGISGPPEVVGSWAPVDTDLGRWPQQATHAALMTSGKVLWWRGTGGAVETTTTYVWDPESNTTEARDVYLANHFCAGLGSLPDGRIITIGGTERGSANEGIRHTSLFDAASETWSPQATSLTLGSSDMAQGRWYPTLTTLPDGRVLAVSGHMIARDDSTYPPTASRNADIPELYDLRNDTWTQLPGAELRLPLYPFNFVLPDGRVFTAGPSTTSRVLDVQAQTWTVVGSSVFGYAGGGGATAAMYRPGKVLRTGARDPSTGALDRAEVIDMTVGSPAWVEVSPMGFPRRRADSVLLPDGTVLLVGGSEAGQASHECAVHAAELWDSEADTWTTLASMARPRIYHSTALLLADGRVLAAGGENIDGQERNAEVFSPPYLFKGPQPVIDAAPTDVGYGSSFYVTSAQSRSTASVAVMRPGAVTHNFNQAQSYVPLDFRPRGRRLLVTAPADADIAPPGPYMLFLVSDLGVPSEGHFLQIGPTSPEGALCNNDLVCDASEDCVSCPGDCRSGGSGGAVCGNGLCEAGDGEDCVACPADCNGVQAGRSARFCCGDGDGTRPVSCDDGRCSASGFSCTDVPAGGTSFCCGDGTCGFSETNLDCEVDCASGLFTKIASLQLSCLDGGDGNVGAEAVATVFDRDTDLAVADGVVYAQWSGAHEGATTDVSDSVGETSMITPQVPGPASFAFTIEDVLHTDYGFDRRASIETVASQVVRTTKATVTCGLTCNSNLVCEPTEDCNSCPTDCSTGMGSSCCGNQVCEVGEDNLTCEVDCAN